MKAYSDHDPLRDIGKATPKPRRDTTFTLRGQRPGKRITQNLPQRRGTAIASLLGHRTDVLRAWGRTFGGIACLGIMKFHRKHLGVSA